MSVSYDTLNDAKASLIRKAQGGIVLHAPMEVDIPSELMADKENFVDLKALGFVNLGLVQKSEGFTFQNETEKSEIESFGVADPTRTDIIKDADSIAFVCQETNKAVLDLYYGTPLDDVKPTSNGEVIIQKPKTAGTRYGRWIFIAVDGAGEDAIYIMTVIARGSISEKQEQQWSSESELSYALTVAASTDETLGFAVRRHFAGPGFIKLLERMGFDASTVSP